MLRSARLINTGNWFGATASRLLHARSLSSLTEINDRLGTGPHLVVVTSEVANVDTLSCSDLDRSSRGEDLPFQRLRGGQASNPPRPPLPAPSPQGAKHRQRKRSRRSGLSATGCGCNCRCGSHSNHRPSRREDGTREPHKQKQPCAKIVGVETVDHPSDGQLIDHARRYFEADHMMPPRITRN